MLKVWLHRPAVYIFTLSDNNWMRSCWLRVNYFQNFSHLSITYKQSLHLYVPYIQLPHMLWPTEEGHHNQYNSFKSCIGSNWRPVSIHKKLQNIQWLDTCQIESAQLPVLNSDKIKARWGPMHINEENNYCLSTIFKWISRFFPDKWKKGHACLKDCIVRIWMPA